MVKWAHLVIARAKKYLSFVSMDGAYSGQVLEQHRSWVHRSALHFEDSNALLKELVPHNDNTVPAASDVALETQAGQRKVTTMDPGYRTQITLIQD